MFESCVMPFGLTNAPSIFQRLGINPLKGPSFVTVYINDLLIYSRSWQEHMDHLSRVMARLREVNHRTKFSECHVLTPKGLQNPGKVIAVQAFPAPCNISELCQFLGLTSYYRRFIASVSIIASLCTRRKLNGTGPRNANKHSSHRRND